MMAKPMRQYCLNNLLVPATRVFVCAILLTSVASAQSDPGRADRDDDSLQIPRSSDPGKQPFVRQFFIDEVHMWTSPFRKSTYSDGNGVRYVLPFTLITGALIATDHQTSNLLPNSTDQSTWSLRVSQIGAPYTLAGISAGMYLISKATGNKKARETGFLGAEAILHSQLITQVLKLSTQRERPLDYKANNSGGTAFFKGGDSFPSGHASGSFALATIFASEYGRDHRWVPWVGYSLATLVTASRLSGQKHWASDLFVGSFLGTAVGRYVYREHHYPGIGEDRNRQRTRLQRWTPAIGMMPGYVALAWQL